MHETAHLTMFFLTFLIILGNRGFLWVSVGFLPLRGYIPYYRLSSVLFYPHIPYGRMNIRLAPFRNLLFYPIPFVCISSLGRPLMRILTHSSCAIRN